MRLRATAIACHEGAIVTRCFQARSRNDRKHVLRASMFRFEGSQEDVSSCFYLEAGNPTLHLGIALAARRTLLRSKFGAMKYLGYAVGAVLLLSAFMRVGSRSHGSDMAHAEAIRSVAELDLFPDLADENRPSASEMSDLSAHADRHGCANDLPPFPAIFHPWAENDLEEDP
jgi:hypothetical protein